MIERLILRNFQCHERLKINLDPHVTTIVGPSDRGKSAIMRALKWLSTNRPGGDAFVRKGQPLTKVLLKLDGREIRRTKGKSRNTYTLDGKHLKSFGSDVPQDVTKLLNINDTNFQSQLDSPFWFNDSAPAVSRSLNQIINLGVIDETLSNLAGMQRDATAQIHAATARSAETETAWKQLKPMKGINKELQAVEALDAEATIARQNATLLHNILADVSKYEERIENARAVLADGMIVQQIGEDWLATCRQRDAMTALLAEADKYRVIANRDIPDLKPLMALADERNAAIEQRDTLAKLIADADRLTTVQDAAAMAIAALEEQFEEQLGERCPLCGRSKTRTR